MVITFETLFNLGVIDHLCSVLCISLSVNKIIIGCKQITVIKDKITPFARTKPKSYPIPNFMKNRATKPPTVVNDEATTDTIVFGRA